MFARYPVGTKINVLYHPGAMNVISFGETLRVIEDLPDLWEREADLRRSLAPRVLVPVPVTLAIYLAVRYLNRRHTRLANRPNVLSVKEPHPMAVLFWCVGPIVVFLGAAYVGMTTPFYKEAWATTIVSAAVAAVADHWFKQPKPRPPNRAAAGSRLVCGRQYQVVVDNQKFCDGGLCGGYSCLEPFGVVPPAAHDNRVCLG
jgi:hypothetical protein